MKSRTDFRDEEGEVDINAYEQYLIAYYSGIVLNAIIQANGVRGDYEFATSQARSYAYYMTKTITKQ